MAQASPDPPSQGPEASSSERQWLSDLRSLLDDARRRFGDVAWRDDDSGRTVYAHKCIVYARATGSFQQRYLGVPHGLSESDLSIYGPSTTSFRTFTPSSTAHRDSLTPTAHSLGRSPRPSSSTCHQSEGESANGNETQALSLGTTDIGVFEAALEYFYTASSQSEAFVVALDGFADGANEEEQGLKGVARLRQDLLYCWRSKLYADVSIVLEGVPGEPFAAHRAILASRSPYFHSLLFGNYSDSDADVFTLPSPPFTPASTTFVLGYLYTGTLDFSPRKFDLATSFEIWRCAAFLSLATLQSAIEAKVLAQLNLARAPRILAFAHAPDVSSVRLAAAATPLVVEQFDTAWTATPHVGHLAYDVQKELVRRVCDRVQPARVADAASRVARARRQLEPERAPWTEHVRGMLDGIEEALLDALAQSLPEVAASRGFVDLIEGVGFSTDVLEWLLTLVVKGLREAKAPRAYQALVGSVLLREEGIMADARVLVDDTRSGILSYIKRKWANIRNAGGFDDLEPWCLKELADELELTTADLTSDGPRPRSTPAKVKTAPRHLVEGIPSSVERPLRSTIAPRPAHVSPAPAPTVSISARTTRLSSSSIASRASTVASRPSAPRAPSAMPAVTAPPARRAASTSATPRARPAPPTTTVTASTPRQTSAARPGRPPVAAPASSSPAVRPNGTGVNGASRPASIRSVASTASSRVRAASTSTSAEPMPRRTTSPTPSVASRRSVASTATTRTNGPSRPPPTRRPAVSTSASPVVPRRTATSSTAPAASAAPVNDAPPRRQASSTSLRSTTSTRTTTAPPLRKPASSTSLASRRSAAATTTGTAGRRPSMSASASATGAAGSATVRAAPRATRPPLVPAAGTSRRSAAPRPAPSPTPGLPGTSLLSGIPCIVTVRAGGPGDGKALRIKAQVRYIGGLVDEAGEWVGVEALESAIPPEAEGLEWGDGSRGEVSYFQLTAPSPSPDSVPPTRAASPALRPPSRRVPRRSTSPSGERERGPRKGLFVRPDQIVYVL